MLPRMVNASSIVDHLVMPLQTTISPLNNLTEAGTSTVGTVCDLVDWRNISIITCFVLVFIVGVLGNTFILIVFIPQLRKGQRIDLLIVYLATCDLLASIFGPGVFIYWRATCNQRWDLGWLGCKIIPALSRITVDVSIGVVLIMAIDRCRSIVFPFRRRVTRNETHVAVAVTVVLSVLCEFYYINSIQVTGTKCAVPAVNHLEFSVPLVITTILRNVVFIAIFLTTTLLVVRKLRETTTHELLGNFKKKRCSHNIKIMKMLVAMAVIFALLVIPRDILHLAFTISWMSWPAREGIKATNFVLDMNEALKVLQISNSCVNFFIYGGMMKHFRRRLKSVFEKAWNRRRGPVMIRKNDVRRKSYKEEMSLHCLERPFTPSEAMVTM